MPIQLKCPNCQGSLQVPDSAAGKRGKCPKCQTAIFIPQAQRTVQPQGPTRAPAAKQRPQPEGEFDLRAAVNFERQAPSVPYQRITEKPCPMCGTMVADTLEKCPQCGESFSTSITIPMGGSSIESYYQASTFDSEADLEIWEILLCIFCSSVACFMGLYYLTQGYPKGWKMILIVLVINIAAGVIGFVMGLMDGAAGG
ncbi:MAG: hypothetical protein ACREJB_04940 [Planctomycetaceae bacterium]